MEGAVSVAGLTTEQAQEAIRRHVYAELRVLYEALGCFFFSSRRRHTRCSRDWSSDVCSSDLVLKGKYLGGTQAVLRFEINGEVQTFNTTDLVALTFTSNSSHTVPAAAPAPTPPSAPVATVANADPGGTVTIPAGQSLLVRMIDGVDSSKNHVGDVFHASLETDLTIGNTVVARKGTDVYGRLAEAKEAGHFSGSPELPLELTRIVIAGKAC